MTDQTGAEFGPISTEDSHLEALTDQGGIPAVIDIATQATTPHEVESGKIYVVREHNGRAKLLDLTDHNRDHPRLVSRTVEISSATSLLDYWSRHHDTSSEIWVDLPNKRITAILDAPRSIDDEPDWRDRARWCAHTAVLKMTRSPALQAWLGIDGKLLDQEAFAEFVNIRMADISSPPGAELLELTRTFEAVRTGRFDVGIDLQSGARRMSYVEEVSGAVKQGQVPLPREMMLALPVWHGSSSRTAFPADIRYRLNHGGPGKIALGIKLREADQIIDGAFTQVVAAIDDEVDTELLYGRVTAGAGTH